MRKVFYLFLQNSKTVWFFAQMHFFDKMRKVFQVFLQNAKSVSFFWQDA